MKTVRCHQYGGAESLQVDELDSPSLAANQIRIRVEAAGVNFMDTLIIQNKYQVKPELPFAPGAEVAGGVIEVGSEVTSHQLGDRVMANLSYGGFSSEVVVDAKQALTIPDTMTMQEAAAFPVVYGTTLYALKQQAQLKAGESLLILGATGGVGMAAVQLGKIMGATVIAVGGDSDKLASSSMLGADHCINYHEQEIKPSCKALTGGRGIDVVYDAVGGEHGQQGLRSLAWAGRLLVVGFASGTIPDFPANWTLIKGSSIIGVFWAEWARRNPLEHLQNCQQLLDWYSEGLYAPKVHKCYPLEQAAQALADIKARKVVGKVVLVPSH